MTGRDALDRAIEHAMTAEAAYADGDDLAVVQGAAAVSRAWSAIASELLDRDIQHPETVEVPLLDLPWRDERRDRRDDQEHRP